MPLLIDTEKPKNDYLLQKSFQNDLGKFVGYNNIEHKRLLIADTIKFYQHMAVANGGLIYDGKDTILESATWNTRDESSDYISIVGDGDATNINIYTINSDDETTDFKIEYTTDNIVSTGLDSYVQADTSGFGNGREYRNEVLGNFVTEWEDNTGYHGTGSGEFHIQDASSTQTITYGPTTVRFSCDGDINVDSSFAKHMSLKNNLKVNIKSRANIINKIPKNEQVAIDTLREMITEREFRKYIKHGFVLVQGQSGRTYQVFRNRHHTKVWQNGKVIEEVCVRIKSGKVPLTDNVIAFKIMIETDENEFKKVGNVYNMRKVA